MTENLLLWLGSGALLSHQIQPWFIVSGDMLLMIEAVVRPGVIAVVVVMQCHRVMQSHTTSFSCSVIRTHTKTAVASQLHLFACLCLMWTALSQIHNPVPYRSLADTRGGRCVTAIWRRELFKRWAGLKMTS